MGLDDFTGDSSQSSSNSNRGGNRSSKATKKNKPTEAQAAFTVDETIVPRDIKYQINSYAINWTKQYSNLRMDCGEVIYYSNGSMSNSTSAKIVVFTTITSEVNRPYIEESQPLRVCYWDFDQDRQVGISTDIEHKKYWKKTLEDTITDYLKGINKADSIEELINASKQI